MSDGSELAVEVGAALDEVVEVGGYNDDMIGAISARIEDIAALSAVAGNGSISIMPSAGTVSVD